MSVPSFCAICTKPRKGLTPHQREDQHGRSRTVYLCVDCDDNDLAELAQHDICDRDGATGSRRTSSRIGGGQ